MLVRIFKGTTTPILALLNSVITEGGDFVCILH